MSPVASVLLIMAAAFLFGLTFLKKKPPVKRLHCWHSVYFLNPDKDTRVCVERCCGCGINYSSAMTGRFIQDESKHGHLAPVSCKNYDDEPQPFWYEMHNRIREQACPATDPPTVTCPPHSERVG